MERVENGSNNKAARFGITMDAAGRLVVRGIKNKNTPIEL